MSVNTQLTSEQTAQLLKIVEAQSRAITILKSIRSTSNLNYNHLNDRSIKIPESLIVQIHNVLQELEQLKA